MMDRRPASLQPQPLLDSAIHIWRATLSAAPEELAYYEALLAPDEHARAMRLHSDDDRYRYIIGRGILRLLLASYLPLDPTDVVFVYGSQGKPALRDHALQFNLSHSNDQVIYGFGWHTPLGIDLEHIRPVDDADELAERFFTKREADWLKALTGRAKWQAFFKVWTCKEACLKALGSGLTVPLDQIEVSFGANDQVSISVAGWWLKMFTPCSGYQSVVATAGTVRAVEFYDFDNFLDRHL